MPTDDQQILVTGTAETPATFTIPGNGQIQPKAIFATYDGTGAGGAFLPAIKVTSDGGQLVGVYPTTSSVAAGGSAEVSWFPFVGGGTTGGGIPVFGFASFAPAAGFITVTATTEGAPTSIVTSGSFTADGVSLYRIDFYVAAVDIQVNVGSTGSALFINLHRGATDLGRVFDYNIAPNGGDYGSINCSISVFDKPPAGATTYSMNAWKSNGVGGSSTCLIYGSNTGPPFTGVTHPGYIAVYAVVQV